MDGGGDDSPNTVRSGARIRKNIGTRSGVNAFGSRESKRGEVYRYDPQRKMESRKGTKSMFFMSKEK
jgi:hypothetical protein